MLDTSKWDTSGREVWSAMNQMDSYYASLLRQQEQAARLAEWKKDADNRALQRDIMNTQLGMAADETKSTVVPRALINANRSRIAQEDHPQDCQYHLLHQTVHQVRKPLVRTSSINSGHNLLKVQVELHKIVIKFGTHIPRNFRKFNSETGCAHYSNSPILDASCTRAIGSVDVMST